MSAPTTLRVTHAPGVLTVTLARPEAGNSLGALVLAELDAALDEAERTPDCVLVVLEGEGAAFCTGMDLAELVERLETDDRAALRGWFAGYMRTLTRLATMPRVVVAKLDGRVVGGGVGLVAASDLVVATPRTTLALPEALWGLLPANVLPFLARRMGFQPAYAMALTTRPLDATEALAVHLVDAVTDAPDAWLRALVKRVARVAPGAIAALKAYRRRISALDDAVERAAVDELLARVDDPGVRRNLTRYVREGRFPWERDAP